MAPRAKVTREQIVEAALGLVRRAGPEAVNARAVAAALGCSTQPVFSHYGSMEALQRDVLAAARDVARTYLDPASGPEGCPPYKAVGLGYIRFAMEEPALFRWLYMRDRSAEPPADDRAENAGVLRLIMEKTGLDEDSAWLFHLEMWLFVHGAAATAATGYVDWDSSLISSMLTDVFEGLQARFAQEGKRGKA